ncbi:MAG: hypothetical protein WBQ23_13140 [Bacteroidota bacterium]
MLQTNTRTPDRTLPDAHSFFVSPQDCHGISVVQGYRVPVHQGRELTHGAYLINSFAMFVTDSEFYE